MLGRKRIGLKLIIEGPTKTLLVKGLPLPTIASRVEPERLRITTLPMIILGRMKVISKLPNQETPAARAHTQLGELQTRVAIKRANIKQASIRTLLVARNPGNHPGLNSTVKEAARRISSLSSRRIVKPAAEALRRQEAKRRFPTSNTSSSRCRHS
jgi:hypothetical protein